MWNLAKVFCFLLVAMATSAQEPLDSARKSFEEAMTSTLSELEESYNENEKCVSAAKSRVESEVEKIVSGLQLPSSQPGDYGSFHKGPLDPNSLKSYRGKIIKEKVIEILGHCQLLFNAKSERLKDAFNKDLEFMKDTQSLYEVCESLVSDSMFIKEIVSRINVHRETLLNRIVRSKLSFSLICEEANDIAKDTISYLKFDIPNQ